MKEIVLQAGKERSLHRYHPWIFSGAVARASAGMSEGEVVKIRDHEGRFLATGHCQVGSIVARVLSFEEEEEIDDAFWRRRVTRAYQTRVDAGLARASDTNMYRLIHGEGDDLPGLVVDIYAGVAVVQFHSVGMYLAREAITRALLEGMEDQLIAIYNKSEGTLPFKSGLSPRNGYLHGHAGEGIALENGLKFHVDWAGGQKTGFFVYQRENRVLFEKYARGRRVLNMFCYTGGFSCYAVRGGALLVHSVDSSARTVELTNKNIELNFNGETRHEAFEQDAFKFLENARNIYDLIVLDHPAFAKHQNVLANAVQGYKKLNRAGFEIIRPGGILFTFSCSQVMSRELFHQTVFIAAANTGRNVKVLHQLSQPPDHPVSIYHPEGEYLKGLVLRVE